MPISQANGHRFDRLLHVGTDVPPEQRPRQQEVSFSLDAAFAAVLALRAHVPQDAFTAGTLGTEREGNGVLIGNDGLILTIGYLVTEAASVELTTVEGETIAADVVGYDQETGFGLVRAQHAIGAEPLARGSAAGLRRGQPVIVAAHGGLRQALSAIIVAQREFAGYWEYLLDRAIFTAPAHPRWSGAALLGLDGRLYGIGSLLVQDARGGPKPLAGNMAVPVDLIDPILDDMVKTGRSGRPPRPWLGMLTTEIEDRLVVAGLIAGGPAEGAGVRVGDFVLAVDGRPVDGLADMFRQVWAAGLPGTAVVLSLFRDGAVLQLPVRTGNRYDYLQPPQRR